MTAAVAVAALEKRALLFARTRIALALACIVAAFVFGRCTGSHGVTPLSGAFADQLKNYQIIAPVDTTMAHIAERSRDSASAAAAAATARARLALAAANREHARADSIARAAAESQTLADSAARLWAALGAKSAEADSLRGVIAAGASALASSSSATLFAVRADTLETSVADKAQAVIASAVKTIQASAPPCRVFAFIHCPSRKAALVTGAVIATALLEAPRLKGLGVSIKL